MINKFIVKFIFCSVGVALLNIITYGVLTIYYTDNDLPWVHLVSVFFRDFLFRNDFYIFHYSIILSILGFVSYFVYEYLNSSIFILWKEELISLSIAIGVGNFIWGIVLMFIGLGLMISDLLFSLFIYLPYVRGWSILFLEDYFNYPTVYFYIFGAHDGMNEFIFGLIYSTIFLLFLFVSFAKNSRFNNNELKTESWALDKIYKYNNRIRFIYFLYLTYLTPTIFVWLYPIILNWLDRIPRESLVLSRIRLSYKVLSYLFVSGFILTIYKIIKNNRVVMIGDMKTEIKNEILNEKNTP